MLKNVKFKEIIHLVSFKMAKTLVFKVYSLKLFSLYSKIQACNAHIR